MPLKLAQAVQEALAQGYQLRPDAYRFLEGLAAEADPATLVVQAVVAKRARGDAEMALSRADLEQILPRPPEEVEVVPAKDISPAEIPSEVEIVRDPTTSVHPAAGGEAFALLFRSRYYKLLAIARQRPDGHQIQRVVSVKTGAREGTKKIAGLVLAKRIRRTSTELVLDDESGRLTVIAGEEGVARAAADVALDQLVIVDVVSGRRGDALATRIYHPDIPDHVPSFAKRRVYAVFVSDLQVGSRMFLLEAFQRLLVWLQGRGGDEAIVRRVKYVVIVGDAVDGAGVYPGQDADLEEPSTVRQYERLAQLLEQVPTQMSVLLIPGNHDPTRQALPQPAVPREHAEPLARLPNVYSLGNPAVVRLHGVQVLLYHGQSLYDVVATTPGLTFEKPAAAMKVLLKARHLAPMYGGRTPLAPEPEDQLVIEGVPDIFVAGHIHTLDAEKYRGTLVLNCGTWQAQTQYQANMGIRPTPALLPVVDLATLDLVVRDFSQPSPGRA